MTVAINRRSFLVGASGLVLTGCASTDLGRGFRSLLGRSPATTVDAHCHIFNAADLAIQGFIRRVVLPEYGATGRWIGDALEWALQSHAPGFEEENHLLDGLIAGESFIELSSPGSELELLDDYLKERRESAPEMYDEMYHDVLGQPRPAGFVDPDAEAAQFIDTAVSRALRWGRLMTLHRVAIARTLLDTYPQVDLFTPAMVDMDRWLDDRARVPLSDQLRLHAKIAQWSAGRIHPLIAYDPLREIESNGNPLEGSLHWVRTAVESFGAIGVKLYPPMGFRPAGNSSKAEAGDRDRALDDALDVFFAWCVENDVPVQAHCNRSNGASPGSEEGANPKYWRMVLERHPSLRLDLGHFGGADGVADHVESSWASEIASLMGSHSNVYADFGFHEIALDADRTEVDAFFRGLDWLIGRHPELIDRFMYGSDWQMIMIKKGHEEYLETYTALIEDRFGRAAATAFRGENAMRFLGLDGAESGNRGRLGQFYAAHGMRHPTWWRA